MPGVLAEQANGAGVRAVEPLCDGQGGGLAGAVGAEQSGHLSTAGSEVNALEDMEISPTAADGLLQSLKGHQDGG
ncbi:hypothetical protein GCM10009670_08330 [Citricoccus alkalitolerans]